MLCQNSPDEACALGACAQMAASGHQTQATSPTAATEGTPFAGQTTGQLPGPLRIDSTAPLDGPSVSGSEISAIVGVRIATPFFGTGFNFCIGTRAAPHLQDLLACSHGPPASTMFLMVFVSCMGAR